MKYLVVGFFGWLLGAVAAGAVLYYNPLIDERSAAPAGAARALQYRLPDDVLSLIPGETTTLLIERAGEELLWEETIRGAALLSVQLRDAEGAPVAVASRLMAGSAASELLLRGLLVDDHWLITFPAEGSVFVRAQSNLWPFLKNALIPARVLGNPIAAPMEFLPTVGPGRSGTAIVLGGTGTLAGLEGTATERYRVSSLEPLSADAALNVDLAGPPVAAAD